MANKGVRLPRELKISEYDVPIHEDDRIMMHVIANYLYGRYGFPIKGFQYGIKDEESEVNGYEHSFY